MKILVIFGSPHRNGNTAKMTAAFLRGFSKEDSIEIVHAFELSPVPCNSCGYCKAADGCSKKDLDSFIKKLEDADVIVVASPVYLLSMPAPMKALFDRFQRYFEARFRRGIAAPIEKPKQAVLLVTAGRDGKLGFEVIKEQVRMAFSVMNTKLVGGVLKGNTDAARLTDADLNDVYALARRL